MNTLANTLGLIVLGELVLFLGLKLVRNIIGFVEWIKLRKEEALAREIEYRSKEN